MNKLFKEQLSVQKKNNDQGKMKPWFFTLKGE